MSDHTIVDALAAVMADVQAVKKADRNDHGNYNFRGIDAVVNAVGPALRAHGVVVVPSVEDVRYDEVTTSKGKPANACRVVVSYTFWHGDSSLSTRVAAEAWDHGDKAAPKAMSVAFRTALLQALTLPTDEPDPDSHTYERSAVDLGPLREVIGAAKAAGLQGDYDATLEWAAESQANADAAARKLRAALLADSNDEASDAPPASDGVDEPSPSTPTGEDTAPSDAAPPTADAVSSPEPTLDDWAGYARDRGVTKLEVMNGLRAAWEEWRPKFAPDDAKKLPPNKSSEIDEWAAGYPEMLLDVIGGLAEAKAGAR